MDYTFDVVDRATDVTVLRFKGETSTSMDGQTTRYGTQSIAIAKDSRHVIVRSHGAAATRTYPLPC